VNLREPAEPKPQAPAPVVAAAPAKPRSSEFAAIQHQEDAPPCSTCGSLMIRSGSCYKCTNCGTTSGCA
jgi:ribonucleoside-diphosphate reductase alpha chain